MTRMRMLNTTTIGVFLANCVLFGGCGGKKNAGANLDAHSNTRPPSNAKSDSPQTSPKEKSGYVLREEGDDFNNGTPRMRQTVKVFPDGTKKRHGQHVQFWENGQKKLELNYVDDVLDGPRVSYYDDGTKFIEGAFSQDKEHGPWKKWYPSGKIWEEWGMSNGAFHGRQVIWYEDGKKALEGNWKNGRQVGVFQYWAPDGSLDRYLEYADPTP